MPLQSPSDKNDYSSPTQDRQTGAARKRSNSVPAARSKNVRQRVRRSGRKDAKTIEKIHAFDAALNKASGASLVGDTTPSTSPNTPNFQLPVWSLTDDLAKVFAATVSMQLEGTRPVPFVFNLTPKAIATASKHPSGFIDHLKRRLAKELEKVGAGSLPYWFALDIDKEKRLHFQGAFLPVTQSPRELVKVRAAMKAAWGEWQGPGKHLQSWFGAFGCDDGWATYCMRNQRAVAKIIGPRTFTMTQGLRKEAQSTYGALRRLIAAR